MLFKRLLIVNLLIFIVFEASVSQNLSQVVRGRIIEKVSKLPISGATIILQGDTADFIATATDIDGYFRLEKIIVGRHSFKVSALGFEGQVLSDILVESSREVVLNIELSDAPVTLDDVTVKTSHYGAAQNDFALISARSFTVSETERYAGSRGDPARMASNFAGVQGADDSRNDIIIRGNSPQGVLWQVENIPIPNPNHFAIPGTGGGPVNIINNKTLANSDFYTGAFPAQYGNGIAGVFDLSLRNGNNEQYEGAFQFGFLGTELLLEGPMSKEKKSSFLVNYRYSSLALFSAVNFNIGTDAVPRYQDGSFKLSFPSKRGIFSLWGIGGKSNIDIVISDQKVPGNDLYGDDDRDQYFGTDMGVVGMTYNHSFKDIYWKNSLAASVLTQKTHHEFVYRHLDANQEYVLDSLADLLDYKFKQNKITYATSLSKKIGSKSVIKLGVINDMYLFSYVDSVRELDTAQIDYYEFSKRWGSRDNGLLLQPYLQWKYDARANLSFNFGIHSQYFSLNNSQSLFEPRASFKWDVRPTHTISGGVGVHSQMISPYLYFYSLDEGKTLHNKDIGFIKSNHYILGYEKILGDKARVKTELYYQNLYNIPVTVKSSSFSLINTGSGFERFFPDTLQNTGTGSNYGIELTVERFFQKKYFFLITGALFQSKYTGSDGVERDTDFNGNYALNFLGTRTFKVKQKNMLSLGLKITYAGGRRYGPADIAASQAKRELVYIDSLRNTLQFRDYFRADLKINYVINRKKVTHEIALDLINILGVKNVLTLSYVPDRNDPSKGAIIEQYQLGFLPLFYYRLGF